jgi:anti-sigma factor RsiW
MKPIEGIELSGYLDGELEPDRAREVEAALERDPVLRAEFEALAEADKEWKSAGRLAGFVPQAQLPKKKSLVPAAVLVLLVGLRLMPKISDMFAWALVLHATVLAIALPWVVRMAREDIPGSRESKFES